MTKIIMMTMMMTDGRQVTDKYQVVVKGVKIVNNNNDIRC